MPNAKLEKGLRGFRKIALQCVFQVVHDCSGGPCARREEESVERENLHVGAERERVTCRAHAGATDEFNWEWQEDRQTVM